MRRRSGPPNGVSVAWCRLAPAAAIMALVGCGMTPEPPPVQAPSPAQASSPATPALVAEASPEPIPNAEPLSLVGLATDSLEQIFGRPTLVRHDRGAEVWQYGKGDCVLDLFLYVNDGEPVPRVSYLETRDRNGEPSPGDGCLLALRLGNGAGS